MTWDPLTDVRTSAWEVALHLAKRLDQRGLDEAAGLMQAASRRLDLDTVKELAYYLYSVCERKGWSSTALLFNGLVTSWLDLKQPGGPARDVERCTDDIRFRRAVVSFPRASTTRSTLGTN